MRKLAIGVVAAALVVAGGAYYGIAIYPQQRFRSELDQAIARLPAGVSASYREAEYDWLANRAKLRGAVLRRTDGLDVAVDEIEVTNPSLDLAAAWAKAASDPAALKPDTALSVSDAIVMTGITGHFPPTSVTAGSARFNKLRIYPWALLQPGVPAFAEIQPALLGKLQPKELADLLPLVRFEAAAMLGLGYDGYTVENMTSAASVPATPTTPAMAVTYRIAKTAAGRYERGSGAAASVDGLTMELGPLGTASLDHMSFTGLDAAKPLGEILAGKPLATTMLDGLGIGRIEYAGMAFKPAAGAAIPLGTIAVSKLGFAHGLPVSGELAYSGLHMTSEQIPHPQVAATLKQLGLDAATLSLGFSYSYDVDQQRLALRDVRVKIDELGMLELSLDAAGFVPGATVQDAAQLSHARLRYTDASLTDRALRAQAAMSGNDPAALRQQLVAAVQQQAAQFGDSPAIAAIAKALATFLGAPQSLTVELAPPSPVPLAALQAAAAVPPAQLVSMLGLSVTANQ